MLTHLQKRTFICVLFTIACCTAFSQSIRSYGQVYSANIRGGTAIFGNTSMNIVDNNVVNLTKMNETGNAANGQGGIGFSQYGNDGNNMQPAMIDAAVSPLTFIATGATWSYNNPSTDQGTAWRTLSSPPPANWSTGAAPLGYGGTQTTTITAGKVTNYFLKTITVPSPSVFSSFAFSLTYNDGAVVYVNGVEVHRANMPAGAITYSTLASSTISSTTDAFTVPRSAFAQGTNVIAVEVHEHAATNTKLVFSLSVIGTPFAPSNATSADLSLPAGTNTIKFARLYWGGRIDNSAATATDTLLKIKLRKGSSGGYADFTAPSTSHDEYAITTTDKIYQSYVDITSFIQAGGNGTYTVANIPCTAGSIQGGGHYAGWSIVIAYENLAQPFNSVRIYDGFAQVYNSGTAVTQNVTLTGLNVPNNGLSAGDALLSTMVWEGDANLGATATNPDGDFVKVNGTAVSNGVNPVTNFWNGSISYLGSFVTTKNPNYTNQMGIDIDVMDVSSGYGIAPNATSVNFIFGTEADQYFPSIFAFQIRMKDPIVTINKTVADANGDGHLQSNEVMTYTLAGANTGLGAGYNTTIVDSLPTNVTYVPGSLIINSAPGITTPTAQTDASGDDYAFEKTNGTRNYVVFYLGTGATATQGGVMTTGDTYNVSFKCKAMVIPGSVTNTGNISANSQSGELFTDVSTAVIAPDQGTTPVKLLLFTAALKDSKTSVVSWTTENELNNHHFDVERSDDGTHFTYRGTVAGSGTTSTEHNYGFNDALTGNSSIVYYRLKIVDLDGQYAYSKIVALRIKGAATSFSVFPNPFDVSTKVYVSVGSDVNAQFRLISFDGKEVMNRTIALAKGDNVVILNNLSNIMSGSYILEVNTGSEKLVQKVIKK